MDAHVYYLLDLSSKIVSTLCTTNFSIPFKT